MIQRRDTTVQIMSPSPEFFRTVENLGWGDVERGHTKIFDPPTVLNISTD